MVQNEYEYIEYLVNRIGLQENTAYSYGRYLEAVSSHLNMSINDNTVSDVEDVDLLIIEFSETDLAQNYKNNCGTALRAYLKFVSETAPVYVSPDEITDPDKYIEGAKKKITVNAYERDTDARNKCIELHGLNCKVCKMDFETVYGDIGISYIHVHHLVPLSTINESYSVDPEKDLIPVCPNCHAMLHRPKENISINKLQEIYSRQQANK